MIKDTFKHERAHLEYECKLIDSHIARTNQRYYSASREEKRQVQLILTFLGLLLFGSIGLFNYLRNNMEVVYMLTFFIVILSWLHCYWRWFKEARVRAKITKFNKRRFAIAKQLDACNLEN